MPQPEPFVPAYVHRPRNVSRKPLHRHWQPWCPAVELPVRPKLLRPWEPRWRNNGQPAKPSPPKPLTKQQKCAAAKANYAAGQAHAKALGKMNLKEVGAGIAIGCVSGVVTGEAIETPLIGTPAAVGNCAVGAIGGGLTAEAIFAYANFGDIMSGTISDTKAVAQMIQNCF